MVNESLTYLTLSKKTYSMTLPTTMERVKLKSNCWRQEYLTLLREFHKISGKNEIEIKVGDVVQANDDPKGVNWRLAIKEKDSLVQAADINTSTGYTNGTITKYPLEVTSTTHTTTKPTECSKPTTCIPTKSTRPVRRTAQVSREKRKHWASELALTFIIVRF